MTVLPNGNVDVTCATTTGPGAFTLVGPTNLATNSTTSGTTVRVTRSSGSSGAADVSITTSGTSACSASSSVSFADGDSAAKGVIVTAGATPGTCVLAISPSIGTVSGGTHTITIVDPDADVQFAFQSSSSNASVGGGPVPITVTRSGGTNGNWTVPITVSGSMSTGPTSIATGAGTLSTFSVVINAGQSSNSTTFTPPASSPSSVGLPANLVLSLGTPTGGVSGQNGTAAAGDHTLTLTGPVAGCPVPETLVSPLGDLGSVNNLRPVSGAVTTYELPSPGSGRKSGVFGLYATTTTFPRAPFQTEIHINKCKGLVEPTNDGCYVTSGSDQKLEKIWITDPSVGSKALLNNCLARPSEGPWYVNVRFTYASCITAGNCGWHAVWKNYSY